MMVRAVYFLFLGVLAVAIIGIQLDRQAYDDPAMAELAPHPFRAVAQQRLVEAELAGEDRGAVLADARNLVRKRPLPARHLVLYAQAAQFADDSDSAIAALEVSAVRGWREPITQIAAARAGLLSGDYASVAQRVAALSATGVATEHADAILTAMLEEEAGRQALAQLLEGEGAWKRYFIPRLAGAGTAEQFTDTIEMAWDLGASLDCAQLRRQATRFVHEDRANLAARIWQGNCAAQELLSP